MNKANDSILSQNDAVTNKVFERRFAKQSSRQHEQGIKPEEQEGVKNISNAFYDEVEKLQIKYFHQPKFSRPLTLNNWKEDVYITKLIKFHLYFHSICIRKTWRCLHDKIPAAKIPRNISYKYWCVLWGISNYDFLCAGVVLIFEFEKIQTLRSMRVN